MRVQTPFATRCAAALLVLLGLLAGTAARAEIYGYIDENGTAHFASEKIDGRYRLMFRNGQSFDTASGIGKPAAGPGGGKAAKSLLNLFERSSGYQTTRGALRDAARRHAIDYELLQALVATESGFNPTAVSPKGAVGLMQVMPATAERYGVQARKDKTVHAQLHDPLVNVAAGSRYLRDLIRRYSGRLELALAAYNAGEGAVQRAGNRIPNYPETQNYVKTVMELYTYLKPSVANPSRAVVTGNERSARSSSGGRVPGRVRMELPPVRGPDSGAALLSTPTTRGSG